MLEVSDVLKFEEVIHLGTFTDTEPIILGEGIDGQAITLVECSEDPPHIDLSNSDSPMGVLAYRPRYVVRGRPYEKEKDFAFNQLTVDYYGLQVWADPRRRAGRIRPNTDTKDGEPLDDIFVSLEEFSIRIRRDISSDSPPKSVPVTKCALIEFLTNEPRSLDEYLPKLFYFQTFLSLAMRKTSWPILVLASNGENKDRPVSIHFAPISDFNKVDDLTSSFMYFTLVDILPHLKQGLENWFAKAEKLDNVQDLYVEAISRGPFLKQQVMSLIVAIEVYHREMHKKTYIDDSKYEKVRETLKSAIPDDTPRILKQRISDSLTHTNNPSLRGRLKDIRAIHQGCSNRLFDNYNTFVNDVVNTRNYYTHFDAKSKQGAKLDFVNLYSKRERLRVILEICLLSELGLEVAKIKHFVRGRAESIPMRV